MGSWLTKYVLRFKTQEFVVKQVAMGSCRNGFLSWASNFALFTIKIKKKKKMPSLLTNQYSVILPSML